MTRFPRVLLIAFFATMLVLAGCGEDDEGNGDVPAADIDGAIVQTLMPAFVLDTADEYGQFSPPLFVDADQYLLGFLPDGVDAVAFCERLGGFLADKGYEGVPISIRVDTDSPELATGTSGGSCSPA